MKSDAKASKGACQLRRDAGHFWKSHQTKDAGVAGREGGVYLFLPPPFRFFLRPYSSSSSVRFPLERSFFASSISIGEGLQRRKERDTRNETVQTEEPKLPLPLKKPGRVLGGRDSGRGRLREAT